MTKLVVIFAVLAIATSALADEPKALHKARRAYSLFRHPTEVQRVQYVTKLVRLREQSARADGAALDAIDAEVIKHPMPVSADTPKLSRRLVGRWQSSRRPYFYHADLTLATNDDTPEDTRGTWHIDGNQIVQNDGGQTIILITGTDFVYGTNAEHPCYLRRGTAFSWH